MSEEQKVTNPQQGVQVIINQINTLPINMLEELAKTIEEIQINFEPIRDQALDKKSYWTGYAKCSEDFIKVIASRSEFVKQQANNKRIQEEIKTKEAKEKEEIKAKEEKKTEVEKVIPIKTETSGSNGTKKKTEKKINNKQIEEQTIDLKS